MIHQVDLYSTYPNAVKLLVGNKIDQQEREVTKEEGDAFAREVATRAPARRHSRCL
jgi:hypothetical protein